MTVLLVDDQISILSGLISGLDWNNLGITSIKTADNAAQAKEILRQEPVDIMLCDIEMPGENGLSLLRWARNRGMDFICVFLTSHADFLYAKEAIQLNCFDYILQPARYDEIQATVSKAIARAKTSGIEKQLEQFGAVAKNHAAGLFQNLFSDWVNGKPLAIPTLQSVLRQLGQELFEDSECFFIWGHLLRWHAEIWSTHDWVYALNNMMTEFYAPPQYGALSFSIDHASLGWFIYAPGGHFQNPDRTLTPLNEVYEAITDHLSCDFAFYATPVTPLNKTDGLSSLLQDAKRNNVLLESGIFRPARRLDRVYIDKFLDVMQLRRWESLLTDGQGESASDEVCGYLDLLAKRGAVNQEVLRGFWMQFQQSVLNAARALSLNPHKIVGLLEKGAGAQSLQEMKTAVKALAACFPAADMPAGHDKRIVEKVNKYVEDHMNQPLSIADIATHFFLNPDYLSRMFKNETGTALKEYIIGRKMQSARILLRTTALPVNVIASKLGYDNYSYFSQVYRKTMGVSPKDERKGGAP